MWEVKITMLGANNVGKTSLLTVMYDRFATTIGSNNLQLQPDLETVGILQECLGQLKSLVARGNYFAKGGIRGTEEPRSFFFDLGKPGRESSLRLHFQDYPGGWIESQATRQEIESVQAFIRESDAVVIAIHAPALMEPYQQDEWKGQWHEKFNTPMTIKTLFQEAYKGLESPKLVILAPVKCEQYIRMGKSEELLSRIQEKYEQLLSFFKAEALLSKVAVVVTPVQTVGSVVFSHIEEKDGKPSFEFNQIGNREYSPSDSEQPLRYLLRFLLKKYTERGNLLTKIWRELWGSDEAFKRAATEVAKGCKNTDGFAVLQGQSLLD